MTKPKYMEFYVNDTAFNDTMGLNYVALPKETRKWIGVRTIEYKALTDLQEQCDRLEAALSAIKDISFYNSQYVAFSITSKIALAEYRKWKNDEKT